MTVYQLAIDEQQLTITANVVPTPATGTRVFLYMFPGWSLTMLQSCFP